jgi:hypothetical protein
MATSSIPAAIDYLVTQARALPAFAAPVVVCDGWPDQRADAGLVVGLTPEDPDTVGEPFHAEVGAQTQWEVYDIPCLLWARIGGSDMQAARNAAFALFNALDSFLRANRTLGGALHSGTALMTGVRIEQSATAAEAGDGRTCKVRFVVRCKNRSTA